MRAWLIVAVAACGGDNQAPIDAAVPIEATSFAATPNHQLDLLFMIDDSNNTLEYQGTLRAALPALFTKLYGTLDPPDYDLHIGVVTSDLGSTGSLDPTQPAPTVGSGAGSCGGLGKDGALQTFGAPISDAFLADAVAADGTRTGNYTGAMTDALSAMTYVGANGCGFEQHLRAVERALGNPANAGFLRDTANLGIVLVGDEDDCSVRDSGLFTTDTTTLGPLQSFRCTRYGVICDQPLDGPGQDQNCRPAESSQYIDGVAPIVQAVLAAKGGDARKIMASAIVAPPTPFAVELRPPPGGGTPILALAHSCSYIDSSHSTEDADPAVRDTAFVAQLTPYSAVGTICQDDFTAQVSAIGAAVKRLLGDPCLPDASSGCTVSDVLDSDPQHPIDVPACPSTGDCFELSADPQICPDTADHVRVVIHRTATPAADAWVHVRCAP